MHGIPLLKHNLLTAQSFQHSVAMAWAVYYEYSSPWPWPRCSSTRGTNRHFAAPTPSTVASHQSFRNHLPSLRSASVAFHPSESCPAGWETRNSIDFQSPSWDRPKRCYHMARVCPLILISAFVGASSLAMSARRVAIVLLWVAPRMGVVAGAQSGANTWRELFLRSL